MQQRPASNVRVRIAPSPTGPVHVGNLHTALFNWLFARHHGGTFVLRFEDTDRARSDRKWEDVIYQEMRWLGLDWDEAPDIGGPYGPYRQTERLALYREYAERLLASAHAYRCFCTPEDMEAERARAQDQGRRVRCPNGCPSLSEAEQKALIAEERPYVVRFAVPNDRVVRFDDLIRGPIDTPTDSLSDFVIVRANGVPLYNFAVVIDDITMRITHVIRGESHISNTPAQLLIYQALGVEPPRIGHLGDLLGTNRKKLSKRDGDAFVGDFRAKGYLADAMVNFMALMGWAPPGDDEICDRETMIGAFALDDVSKAPATFDLTKLDWLNGHYIRSMRPADLTEACLPYLQEAGLIATPPSAAQLELAAQIVALQQPRLKTLADITEGAAFVFADEIAYDEKSVHKVLVPESRPFLREVAAALTTLTPWTHETIEAAVRELADARQLGARQAFQPVRVAVTGSMVSPPLFESLEIVGQAKTVSRLHHAVENLYP